MENSPEIAWRSAIGLLSEWQRGSGHLDDLLDNWDPGQSRWLVMEVFRNWLPVEATILKFVKKLPRPLAMSILRLAVAEVYVRSSNRHAQIVHHAVDTAKAMGVSKSECRFLNAVLRRMLREEELDGFTDVMRTHPHWLIERWTNQFGKEATKRFLEWNQQIPGLTISADNRPDYASETEWEDYYKVEPEHITMALDDLRSGITYAQDPFARIPVRLLDVQTDEMVLDLCAAPGGKTRLLSRLLSGSGRIVALDQPGRRFDRLKQNTSMHCNDNVTLCASLLEEFDQKQLTQLCGSPKVPAVLIDVPCSNTGVIQRRPDVKLRLEPDDIRRQAIHQLKLLSMAADFVAPGGRIVYSTCSVEKEENEGVVEAFTKAHPRWSLQKSVVSYPWQCGHDGGGAFLLTNSNEK